MAGMTQSAEVNKAIQEIGRLAPAFATTTSYPYVITGDLNASELHSWKQRIRRTQRALTRQFFKNSPSHPITVWLFKSEDSYARYHQRFWGSIPGTPYGYYLPPKKRMVMNIASGGGTLTHELVHPYITVNFPQSPLWFQEGFASLFEQSRYDFSGNIFGMNNWRLGALQAAVSRNTLQTLTAMMKSSDQAFYGLNRSLNYAQARYLMFYLQSKGLLKQYYVNYRRNFASDPDGIGSLLEVTGVSNMATLEQKWRRFVLLQKY